MLTAPLTAYDSAWVIITFLILFYAGELVWRERDTGVSEINDAAPVPEWVPFLGKFLGLGLALAAVMALVAMAGVLTEMSRGHHDVEIGLLYVQALFGLQPVDYLLFAVLALVVHVMVDQKYIGHLVGIIAFVLIAMPSKFGIEHNLLVYSAGPGWSYTEMRGFGPFLGPWLWFKLYWVAWALLLAVVARLLWVRGKEGRLGVRLQRARRRFTRPAAGVAAAAVGLVLTLGGFIFYNTNVLNEYRTTSEIDELRAEYERRYGRYEDIPQPRLTGTNLHVEIYPDRRDVEIRGTYRVVNGSAVASDSIHGATAPGVETGALAVDRPAVPVAAAEDHGSRIALALDRPARPVLADEELGHHIYALEQPLQPGDSLQLRFEVRYEPRGFDDDGVGASVVANGTWFTNRDWLPRIGYQRSRELSSARDRRACFASHGTRRRR